MYAEEYLGDDANEYFDISDVSIEEKSSIDTEIREHRKLKEIYKRLNKDYYSFKRKVFDGEGIRMEKVELYSSPLLTNGFIRNATTGITMEHRVGSKYEDLYFRVKDVGLNTGGEPRKLFYKNPEEFERHQFGKVSQNMKKQWSEKYMKARAILEG